MNKKKGFNEYEIRENISIIFLKDRYNKILAEAIIDTSRLDFIENMGLSFHAHWNSHTNSYYARTTIYLGIINGRRAYKTLCLHQILLETDKTVDHINTNSLDNRMENLRETTINKNSSNRKSKNRNNTTGVRNVSLINEKYVVQLQINGKNTRIGKFDNIKDAEIFAKEMREKYYGEFAGNN